MTETAKPTMDDYLKAAGPVLAQRQMNPAGKLSDEERLALQEATLAVVREFRAGRSNDEIQNQLTQSGWQPTVAAGFISLVSQLLSKMHRQRTFIFAGVSVFTCMIASIAIPEAAQGEFPWWAAVLSTVVALISVLGTLRNWQLHRQYRQHI